MSFSVDVSLGFRLYFPRYVGDSDPGNGVALGGCWPLIFLEAGPKEAGLVVICTYFLSIRLLIQRPITKFASTKISSSFLDKLECYVVMSRNFAAILDIHL